MERAAGIILFRMRGGVREYVLLKYPQKDYWGLVKGRIERGESLEDAALREAREETGLREVKLRGGLREEFEYYFTLGRERVHKKVAFFLGEVFDESDGKVSWEHEALKWLSYPDARRRITFKKDRDVLDKAEQRLSR